MNKDEVRKTLIDFGHKVVYACNKGNEFSIEEMADSLLKSINESLNEVPALPTNEDKEKKCQNPNVLYDNSLCLGINDSDCEGCEYYN